LLGKGAYVKPAGTHGTEWTVEVGMRPDLTDAEGRTIAQDIADLGISTVGRVRVSQMYWLEGDLGPATVRRLAARLLTDAVSQESSLEGDLVRPGPGERGWAVAVRLKEGVTDAVGESVRKGAADLGIHGLSRVRTGRKVYVFGDVGHEDIVRVSERLLANEVIQVYQARPLAQGGSVR
jgi:phosphoribosylformylglycinamidine (FGAM) synthase PurS component